MKKQTQAQPGDIRLFNKGKRTIQGHYPEDVDAEGKVTKSYSFKPATTMAFRADEANKLRRLYPKEVVSLEDVTREFDTTEPETKKKGKALTQEDVDSAVAEAVTAALAKAKEDADLEREIALIEQKEKLEQEMAEKEEEEEGSEPDAGEKKDTPETPAAPFPKNIETATGATGGPKKNK